MEKWVGGAAAAGTGRASVCVRLVKKNAVAAFSPGEAGGRPRGRGEGIEWKRDGIEMSAENPRFMPENNNPNRLDRIFRNR